MKDKMFDLAEKVVLVTGGTGLLGKEFCETLSDYGANVIVVDLNESDCKKQAESLAKKYGTKAIGVKADITNRNEVAKMVSEVVKKLGKVDVLVNNAAGKSKNFYAKFEDYPLEDWEKVMSVNLTGAFLCAQAVGKQMAKQNSGSIINISSVYGIKAPDQRIYKGTKINTPAVYSASKAGLIGLTTYLATYWADKNIRVNCISPGGVFNNQENEFVKKYSEKTPLGRMANKNELSGAVLFLASDASSYVTGHNLVVDGGLTIW
ncbi:TPA: SDR family oxidoreductase [archaeon]|uniref:SDR family oxidoreductase n=1 Tax=Candidatus Naiadarchaeum limnaeum TaxID=2756139 RepID=A0A832VAR9_9ARCH|nr:SDR family oxidoreductase [Candidatus Naiadarchaeales archaeon SRR2090153.bin1042]HIK00691.1 SDR family oxidoreductase [Candidatus Naiadarchaeum limnaeum]